jgi:hypothetical protein
MTKLTLVLLFSLFAFPLSKKTDNTNIYMTEASRLFASDVTDISRIDFANRRAVFLPLDKYSAWQQLKKGKGRTQVTIGKGVWDATQVELEWQKQLDPDHMVVAYIWMWVTFTSSESEVVQVFERRDGKAYIVQQIVADRHNGEPDAGATFDEKTQKLTVKSVELDSPLGRCCPRYLNVAIFSWDGARLRRMSATRQNLPKSN